MGNISPKLLDSKSKQFLFYPTPANSSISIHGEIDFNIITELQVFNLLGMKSGSINVTSREVSLTNLNLSNGIYIFKLVQNGVEKHSQRISILHD